MRYILNGLTALSLVLCVTTAALWLRSQRTFTRVWYTRPLLGPDATRQRRLAFLSWRDRVGFSIETELFHPEDTAAGERLKRDLPRAQRVQVDEHQGRSTAEDGLPDLAAHPGFYYRSPEVSRQVVPQYAAGRVIGGAEYFATSESWRSLFVPWWSLVVAFAGLPATTLGRRLWLWSRRRPFGRCPQCNYDLTGNVSGTCPECGRKVPQSAAEPPEANLKHF